MYLLQLQSDDICHCMWGSRVCDAAMACKVKFSVSFLSFVSWFLLSDDVTDGLGTGKIFWLWCYFKVDGSRRKYIVYPQELFYLTQTTWQFPVGISRVTLVGHESWLAWAAARLTLSCSLWLGNSGGRGDPALQKRIWGKQYLNYSSCSANCSLGQHWLVLNQK